MLTVGTDTYITVKEADELIKGTPGCERWGAYQEDEKEAYLKTAAWHINVLRFAGRKHSIFQDMAFPRGSRRGVPDAVKRAQALEALSLTDTQANTRRSLQRQGVTSISLGKASESYTGAGLSDAAEILSSAEALALLRPWLVGSVAIV